MPWKNPTMLERKRALLGSTRTLKSIYRESYSPGVRKLLETSYKTTSASFFKDINNCDPSDWLLHHNEDDQTYHDFWRSCLTGIDYNFSSSLALSSKTQKRTICILPIGPFPTDHYHNGSMSSEDDAISNSLLFWLKSYCASFFHTAKVVMLPPVQLKKVACDYRVNEFTGRFQLNAYDILGYLRRRKTTTQHCLVAVTMIDLFPKPSWNFVFGLASTIRGSIGGVGVFSFSRYDNNFYERWSLRKDVMKKHHDGSLDYSVFSFQEQNSHQKCDITVDSILLLRACKVMTHEVCHMFGLKHCTWMKCLMNGTNHLAESDRRPPRLCPICLRKLQSVLNFNILERYKRIYKWTTEESWTDRKHLPIFSSPKLKRRRPKSAIKSSRKTEIRDSTLQHVSLRRKRSGSFRRQSPTKSDTASIKSLPLFPRTEPISPPLPLPPLKEFRTYRNWLWEAIEFIVCDGKPALLSYPTDEI